MTFLDCGAGAMHDQATSILGSLLINSLVLLPVIMTSKMSLHLEDGATARGMHWIR